MNLEILLWMLVFWMLIWISLFVSFAAMFPRRLSKLFRIGVVNVIFSALFVAVIWPLMAALWFGAGGIEEIAEEERNKD